MPAAPADATALLALSGRSGGPGSPSRHEAGAGPAGDEPSGTEVNGDSLSGDCRPSGGCGCPRCGSVDTKFCYFNNYNVKQPRFFCKARFAVGRGYAGARPAIVVGKAPF